MDRLKKLVGDISPAVKVIEIGALCRPLIDREKADVFYVDYADRTFLQARYRDDPNVDIEKIVETDGVWGDRKLKEVVGTFGPVDAVIASHVAEHVPDLIGWLCEIGEVLKPNGVIGLAVPDMRFTFDRFRQLSSLTDLLENHLLRRRIPSVRQVIDHVIHVQAENTARSVHIGTASTPKALSVNDLMGVRSLVEDISVCGSYHDVHCNIFNPLSFATLMHQVVSLDLVRLRCGLFFDTELNQNEFFVRLQKSTTQTEAIESWKYVLDNLVKNGWIHDARQLASIDEIGAISDEDESVTNLAMNRQFSLGYDQARNEFESALAANTVLLDQILKSRSWRLTRPYRWLGSLLKPKQHD